MRDLKSLLPCFENAEIEMRTQLLSTWLESKLTSIGIIENVGVMFDAETDNIVNPCREDEEVEGICMLISI